MTLEEIYALGNTEGNEYQWYLSSHGMIELVIKLEDAHQGSHQGQCDNDISDLMEEEYIKVQLDNVKDEALQYELKGFGDDFHIGDRETLLSRLLWIACGDIVDA